MSPPGEGSGSEDDGDLFGSDSSGEEWAAPPVAKPPPNIKLEAEASPAAPAAGLGMAIFSLDAACNAPSSASTLRLGSLLAGAQILRFSGQVCTEEAGDIDGDASLASGDVANAWHLHLQLVPRLLDEARIAPGDICVHILALNAGIQAEVSLGSTASPREPAIIIQTLAKADEAHSTLMRVLAHVVDLPVEDGGGCQPEKKAKIMGEMCSHALAVEELAMEMEGLLDDFCCERAALTQKLPDEQRAFREAALGQLSARKTTAAGQVQCLLDRLASAQQLSSRDRWLATGAAAVGPEVEAGEDPMVWAAKVSELWHALPEVRRNEFRVAALEDQAALRQQDHQARQLQQLIEEVDVFLANLEPCSLCHYWDPWVESCSQPFCRRRICKTCGPAGCCCNV